MRLLAYPVELTPDDDGTLLVTCPDLPEVTTFGEDEAEALRHALGAIEEVLASRIADREAVPPPSPAAGRPMVALPAQSAAKVELYRVMRAAGLDIAGLAGRLGVPPDAAGHLVDLDRATPLARIEAAFGVLGKRIDIAVRDAA